MSALSACPFCGAAAYLSFFGADRSRAKCLNAFCGAEVVGQDKRSTAERWNRRVPPAAPDPAPGALWRFGHLMIGWQP